MNTHELMLNKTHIGSKHYTTHHLTHNINSV